MRSATNVPADDAVNVLYFNHGGLPLPADFADFCTNLGELYRDSLLGILGGINRFTVTAYDVGAPPNDPLAETITEAGAFEAGGGPREVALCLSYFAGRNGPTTRGRVFIGPLTQAVMTDHPTGTIVGRILDFGQGLDGMGGADWKWHQHSQKLAVSAEVTDIWCDNAWDTQRRRGDKATSRQVRSL